MRQLKKNSKKTRLASIAFVTGFFMLVPGVMSFADEGSDVLPPSPKAVTLNIDGSQKIVNTYSNTVGELLEEKSIELDRRDYLSPSLETELTDNATVTFVNDKKFRIKNGAKKTKKHSYPVTTIAGALQKSHVRLTKDDRVFPALTKSLEPGTLITVTRVSFKTVVKRERVDFKTKVKHSPKMYKGEKKIVVQGKSGVKKVRYERKRVNGEVKYTRAVKSQLLHKPKSQVLLVGTKKRPTNTLTGVWRSLAQCESGLNPHIVSSNGLYHGLFQFSVGTWHSVGGGGVPSQASVSEQIKRAKILQARSGWSPWPACSSALGLG